VGKIAVPPNTPRRNTRALYYSLFQFPEGNEHFVCFAGTSHQLASELLFTLTEKGQTIIVLICTTILAKVFKSQASPLAIKVQLPGTAEFNSNL